MKRILAYLYNELPDVYGIMIFFALMLCCQFNLHYTVIFSVAFAFSVAFINLLMSILSARQSTRRACSFLPITLFVGFVLFYDDHTTTPIAKLNGVVLNDTFGGQGYTQESEHTYVSVNSANLISKTRVFHVDGKAYRIEVIFAEPPLRNTEKHAINKALVAQFGVRYDFTIKSDFLTRSDGENAIVFDGHKLIAYNIALNEKWYKAHLSEVRAMGDIEAKIDQILQG